MPSSGMLCRVALVRINVAEEHSACIIRVTRISKLTLLIARQFLSAWWWRRYILLKRRFLEEPYGITSQKTAFFMNWLSLSCVAIRTDGVEPKVFTVRQLRGSWFGAPTVSTSLVQLVLGLASAVILGCESHTTHNHMPLSHFRIPNLVGRVPVIISPGRGWPRYTSVLCVPCSSRPHGVINRCCH
jgi:hypothetical protein